MVTLFWRLGFALNLLAISDFGFSLIELNTQVGEEIRYLDPQKSTGISSAHICINLFVGLYEYHHKTGEPIPLLAKNVAHNKDFSEYTFSLQNDFYWVNHGLAGVEKKRLITAEDVVYSFRRMLSPKLASEYAYMLYIIKNGQAFNEGKLKDPSKIGVEAIARDKVKITLSGPVPTFLKYLPHHSFALVPKEPIEQFGDAWIDARHIWTSGPFSFLEWKLKDRVTLVKNPFFPEDKAATVDIVNFKFIGTYSPEAVRAFEAGEVDIDYQTPPANSLRKLKKSGRLLIAPQLGTYFIRINVNKKGVSDKKVRRALALVVPRKKIAKYIMKGGQQPAYSLVPDSFGGYKPATFISSDKSEAERYREARSLMVEAGYPGGKGFPELSYVYNTSETHKKIAVLVAKAWKSVLGVKIRPLNEEWRVYLSNQHSLNYDIQRSGWVADMEDPMNFAELFITGGGNNNTGFSSINYDDYINRARIEGDAVMRNRLLSQAEAILMDELPVIPVFSYVSINLKQTYVTGFFANKFDQHTLRHVRIDQTAKKLEFSRN